MQIKETMLDRIDQMEGISDQELSGYYFPDVEKAIGRIAEKANQSGIRGVTILDVDDALFDCFGWQRYALNRYFSQGDPTFVPVTPKEIIEAGGRYYQVDQYQQAAAKRGRSFVDIFETEVQSNRLVYAQMTRHKATLELQRTMALSGMPTVAYFSGRPSDMAVITGRSLKFHGFAEAPVICMSADGRSPAEQKIDFFRQKIYPIFAGRELSVYYFDDDLKTIKGFRNEFSEQEITPVMPLVTRNNTQKAIAELQQLGILFGTHQELTQYFDSDNP
jgi:hypothetical protein